LPVATTSARSGYLPNRGGLIELEVRLARDFIRHQFGYALDVNLRTGFPGALGNRLRHGLDMAVSRVVENKNFGHVFPSQKKSGFWINAYTASTMTTSASSMAPIRTVATSLMATPSRA
jgi:hypothetical protein